MTFSLVTDYVALQAVLGGGYAEFWRACADGSRARRLLEDPRVAHQHGRYAVVLGQLKVLAATFVPTSLEGSDPHA